MGGCISKEPSSAEKVTTGASREKAAIAIANRSSRTNRSNDPMGYNLSKDHVLPEKLTTSATRAKGGKSSKSTATQKQKQNSEGVRLGSTEETVNSGGLTAKEAVAKATKERHDEAERKKAEGIKRLKPLQYVPKLEKGL